MTTSTPTLTLTAINHFINGAESAGEGTRTQPVYNPATGAVSAELRLANRADLDATVAAARNAADSWATSRWPLATLPETDFSFNFDGKGSGRIPTHGVLPGPMRVREVF